MPPNKKRSLVLSFRPHNAIREIEGHRLCGDIPVVGAAVVGADVVGAAVVGAAVVGAAVGASVVGVPVVGACVGSRSRLTLPPSEYVCVLNNKGQ